MRITLSCEAALATLGMIEDEDLLTASSEKGAYVRKRMDQWVNDYDFVGMCVVKVYQLVLISYQINKLRRASEEALKICNYCFDHGLVLIAVAGNVLRFQPPLVITYEQLDYALNTIENALQALQDGQLNNYNIDGQGW